MEATLSGLSDDSLLGGVDSALWRTLGESDETSDDKACDNQATVTPPPDGAQGGWTCMDATHATGCARCVLRLEAPAWRPGRRLTCPPRCQLHARAACVAGHALGVRRRRWQGTCGRQQLLPAYLVPMALLLRTTDAHMRSTHTSQRNGEKRLRALLTQTPQWASSESREAAVRAAGAPASPSLIS